MTTTTKSDGLPRVRDLEPDARGLRDHARHPPARARRLAAALKRQGFSTSIQAVMQDESGAQWCEVVS